MADAEFRLFYGMIEDLAFLPLEEVEEGMEYLKVVILHPLEPPKFRTKKTFICLSVIRLGAPSYLEES